MSSPADFPHRILLAVTGLSPQIVTETVYALAVRAEPRFVPTEVHVITTAEGAERIRLALLSEAPGWFARLRHDYALPDIAFTAENIHVLQDGAGQPLTDIRSPADNLCAADQITELVRALSADPDAALHVSIAGGRKTMGFFVGYALSLFGRAQDRLSHVLVSEPFEASWNFFYPTPYSNVIETAARTLADTRDAQVTLAEIPFVSLRHGLPRALLAGTASFETTVQAARAGVGPATLDIDLAQRRVTAAGKCFQLPPAELALLAVFARRAARRRTLVDHRVQGRIEHEPARRDRGGRDDDRILAGRTRTIGCCSRGRNGARLPHGSGGVLPGDASIVRRISQMRWISARPGVRATSHSPARRRWHCSGVGSAHSRQAPSSSIPESCANTVSPFSASR